MPVLFRSVRIVPSKFVCDADLLPFGEQVLHYQAPQSFLIVLLLTPLFDKVTGEGGLLNALANGTPSM